ncbi:sporulation histidine kinase inhibitor Sda [Alteribacter lacisalsi]|uniref:Sporulation histidine kinase inhibitor Sda n=2 Tax=Alteribacter lacisalsi TaxID=2045244 RepID=A0A2W0HQ16_9BACI|nr:sporulation histidine kinase inhibitor Sda [Alteribacter lacisalsi]PYZ99212.1 sporulation histidine kinase inhibitor Sda [Alteribacter lacisalsi]
MRHLTDDLLIETYHKARELQLHDDFIFLISQELKRRDIASTSRLPEKLH